MNLNDIQLDKQKKILIVIFCILIVYVDLTFILKSQQSGLTNLDTKITRLKNDLKKLQAGLESMRVAKSKENLSITQKAVKPIKILSEGQISSLLQDISKEANKFNVRIIQMSPVREVKSGLANAADKSIAYLINLDLICDYHSLGKFISTLENSSVYMALQELKIITQATDYLKQKVVLVLKTYVTK